MPRIAHRGQGLVLLAVMTLGGAVAARPVSAQTGGAAADLAKIKAGLKKYEDPFAAVMDGYHSTVGCVIIEQAGAPGHIAYKPGGMGVHFINLNLVSPVVDPAKPQGLQAESARHVRADQSGCEVLGRGVPGGGGGPDARGRAQALIAEWIHRVFNPNASRTLPGVWPNTPYPELTKTIPPAMVGPGPSIAPP